jgi:hypothetical protein
VRVIRNRAQYARPREEIARIFSTERTATEYEALFAELKR